MYLKKSGFICLNVYINLPYLYSIDIFIYQIPYWRKHSPVIAKRMIEKKQITITYCRVMCKYGVWRKKTGLWGR